MNDEMPDAAHMVCAMETYCRAQTEKDKAAWMALFADHAVHEDPVGLVRNEGITKIEAFWDGFQDADVELWLTEPPIVRSNELIALLQCRVGPPGGRLQSGRIVDHVVFDNRGLITSVRAFYDLVMTPLPQQLPTA